MIIGGLILYWKLFNRITQYISRRQEFRCDELACHVAGSENLASGLCNIHRAAAVLGLYWNQVVMPVATNGSCPQIADGFARFLGAPVVAKAVASALERELASSSPNSADSHPPLAARVQKARALAVPTSLNDDRAAIALVDDLPALEMQLLQKVTPGLDTTVLKPMHWDTAGYEVYLPLWRKQAAQVQSVLGQYKVAGLPEALRNLSAIASRIPDLRAPY